MAFARQKLDYAVEVADWVLDIGDRYISANDLESAMKCTYVAARIYALQNRDLSCSRIEDNLRRIAQLVAGDSLAGSVAPARPARAAWLHVLNTALPSGGHTAMATRWIRNDASDRVHHVALLDQKLGVPQALQDAVADRGGRILLADSRGSLVERARWLRQLAHSVASRVVLHIDTCDVIAGVAFGVAGGPPVLLVNHAAHTFWTGASFADLVVNCRGSQLEESWTRYYRGIARSATVPIPLLETTESGLANGMESRDVRRERLGIPKDALVILTIGDSYKYAPIAELDFFAAARAIVREVPHIHIVAVGPAEDGRWTTVSQQTQSRVRTVGRQSRVGAYHEVADIYIEGFPFGSTTALLEAGLAGLPVVLAPAQCAPPYGSDGVAIDDVLRRPRNMDDYVARVVELSRSPSERQKVAAELSSSIRQHHTTAGWQKYLDETARALPAEHQVTPSVRSVRTPVALHDYWTRFAWQRPYPLEKALEYAIDQVLATNLRPKLPAHLLKSCKKARAVRIGCTVPLPIIYFFCNALMPLLPIRWGRAILQEMASVSRTNSKTIQSLRWMFSDRVLW